MSEASRLRNDVKGTFGPYGRAITLRQITAGPYDNTSGETGASTTTDFTGVGRVGSYNDRLVDGTRIQAKDRMVTFVPDDLMVKPIEGNQIVAGTDVYSLITTKTRELQGELICFTFQARIV